MRWIFTAGTGWLPKRLIRIDGLVSKTFSRFDTVGTKGTRKYRVWRTCSKRLEGFRRIRCRVGVAGEIRRRVHGVSLNAHDLRVGAGVTAFGQRLSVFHHGVPGFVRADIAIPISFT